MNVHKVEPMSVSTIISRFGTAIAGLGIVLFFMAFAPNFASGANLLNVLTDTAFLAILATGFTMALTVAEIDLSVAEVASLAAVICGWLIQSDGSVFMATGAALVVGCVLGLINGWGVTSLRIPSLIMTLGTAAIAKGLSFMVTQGVAFVGNWPLAFTGLARGATLGVPNLLWWLSAITLFTHGLVNWTRIGAHLLATGDADEAARRAGIATGRMKCLGMVMSAMFASVMAVLLAANLSSAAPGMAGDYLLYALASALLGMTMFQPGKPNVVGTVFAAFVLKAVGNGLVLSGAPYYMQDIILGVAIVGSVAFSASAVKRAAFKV